MWRPVEPGSNWESAERVCFPLVSLTLVMSVRSPADRTYTKLPKHLGIVGGDWSTEGPTSGQRSISQSWPSSRLIIQEWNKSASVGRLLKQADTKDCRIHLASMNVFIKDCASSSYSMEVNLFHRIWNLKSHWIINTEYLYMEIKYINFLPLY